MVANQYFVRLWEKRGVFEIIYAECVFEAHVAYVYVFRGGFLGCVVFGMVGYYIGIGGANLVGKTQLKRGRGSI